MVTTQRLTADDLELMGSAGEDIELIDGIPYEVQGVGAKHGSVGHRLACLIGNSVETRGLGEVFSSNTQFRLEASGRDVLRPDASFIRKDRLPIGEIWDGIAPIPPDLVVEISSPGDTGPEIRVKIDRYRAAGVPLVWVVWLQRRAVSVFRPGQRERILGEDDALDGEEVLPGFRLAVAELFRPRGR